MKRNTFGLHLAALATLVTTLLVCPTAHVDAQAYRISFRSAQPLHGDMYYLARPFRNNFITVDSARLDPSGKEFTFSDNKLLPQGIFSLLDSRKKRLLDVVIDDSQRFTLNLDSTMRAAHIKVSGSKSNADMQHYIAQLDEARAESNRLKEAVKKANPTTQAQLQADMDRLNERMRQTEQKMFAQHRKQYFFKLTSRFSHEPQVNPPATLRDTEAKTWSHSQYLQHYWDSVDLSDHSLIYTPHLFEKANYYFFGAMFHDEADTIIKYAFQLLDPLQTDSTMLRYFLDFVTLRYKRSTTMVGWDQVYVALAQRYYLQGHCPWATRAELMDHRRTVEHLSHSLIGAQGTELWMADTNQSPDPADWHSSHRQPYDYIILWFWDPDCNHCRQQTAELQQLYDSLSAAGTRNFEVYAVGYTNDTDKWKRYVRQHQLPFVNVGGANVNVDYQVAYNVHGAPTMIILNKERRIIMNKPIAIGQLLEFLKRYETRIAQQPPTGTR